ncbi:hypothetical protein V6Z12_D08G057300 [Gossypium hirsutum]
MRTRYLKAVLRQEVGYFDLNMTNTAEVVAGIANDCFTIQEVISEKVPTLITRGVTFIGTCIAAFLILWRLAIVFFPFLSAAASYFNIWKSFTISCKEGYGGLEYGQHSSRAGNVLYKNSLQLCRRKQNRPKLYEDV